MKVLIDISRMYEESNATFPLSSRKLVLLGELASLATLTVREPCLHNGIRYISSLSILCILRGATNDHAPFTRTPCIVICFSRINYLTRFRLKQHKENNTHQFTNDVTSYFHPLCHEAVLL
ncbi:MAG: hypothetical protein ACK4PR_10930 [Gammaproteobacteria bacterium]